METKIRNSKQTPYREYFGMQMHVKMKSEAAWLAEQENKSLSLFVEEAVQAAINQRLKDKEEPRPPVADR